MTTVLGLLDGDAPSLSIGRGETFSVRPSPGSLVFIAAGGIDEFDDFEPASEILRLAEGFAIDIGEDEGDVVARAQVAARDEETARHISQVLQGMIALGYLAAGQDDDLEPLRALASALHIETRKEAVTAGLLVGPIGIIPGVFFYLAMIGQYPEIVSQTVPANYLLGILGSRAFQLVFQIILIGTLMETGTGLIHAFNERVAGVFKERKLEMPSWMRPAAAAALLMLLAVLLSRVGLITLIEKGYGTITWGFLIVFVLPVLTIGLAKILRSAKFA